jgi:hypothetical protein
MQQTFRGRKKEPTQNIMAVVNWDMKFTYVLAGWEGSAHDSHILHDAIERERMGSLCLKVTQTTCLLHLSPYQPLHTPHALP